MNKYRTVNRLLLLFGLFTLVLLTSCREREQSEPLPRFPTLAEAVKYGEQHDDVKIISVQPYKDENLVLVATYPGTFSLASVYKNKSGYAWLQGAPFFQTPTYVMFTYQTESGKRIPVVIGKTPSDDTKRVRLESSTTKPRELNTYHGYYLGINFPKEAYTITSVK